MQLFSKKTKNKDLIAKQSRDYRRLKNIKVFNLVSWSVAIVVLGATFWFVYNDVYKTLGQIETIAVIKNIRSFESINFKFYEETTSSWEEKTSPENIKKPAKNLFGPEPIVTTSTPDTPEENSVDTTN